MSEQTIERVEAEQTEAEQTAPQTELVAEDDLVEEVSIDGMCGVY